MGIKTKIGIIGGDSRQAAVASCFAGHNLECALWGIDSFSAESFSDNIVKAADFKGALRGAAAVVLPLPLTVDGVRLNCGKNISKSDVYLPRITELIQSADRGSILFGGKVPVGVCRFAAEHNVRIIDYYESEEFQIKNAVPTAEGAISVAISEMDITLSGCRAAVVGYGRIGRTLALRLKALGCNVTCIARSRRDLAWAECDGCTAVRLGAYINSPIPFDVIFNTVPSVIFDDSVIGKLERGQLFIDLASLNGGIDSVAAETQGIRVVKALSLPGKCSPKTAGKIIYELVLEKLYEEGIL